MQNTSKENLIMRSSEFRMKFHYKYYLSLKIYIFFNLADISFFCNFNNCNDFVIEMLFYIVTKYT